MPPLESLPAGGAALPRRERRIGIDVARGAAVVAMVVYHFAWDLSQLRFIDTDIRLALGWSLFARLIAASFLVLSGISLVLAHRDGIRAGAFLRRTAVLAAAAAAVTAATLVAFPDSFIFFGILHNIAVSSLIALPFLRAPAAVTAAAAAALLLTPLLVTSRVFDASLLVPLGLGREVPVTNDFVPVFPWTGFVLAGVAAGRAALRYMPEPSGSGRPAAALTRAVATLGRKSLAIYLLHQPVLFGSLFALRQVLGPDPVAEARPFVQSCVASCRAAGLVDERCRTACGCTVEELRRDGLWALVLTGRPTAEEFARVQALSQLCLRRAMSPPE